MCCPLCGRVNYPFLACTRPCAFASAFTCALSRLASAGFLPRAAAAPSLLASPVLQLPLWSPWRPSTQRVTPSSTCPALDLPPLPVDAPRPPAFLALTPCPTPESGSCLALAWSGGVVVVDGHTPCAAPLLSWQLACRRGPLVWHVDSSARSHTLVVSRLRLVPLQTP